ncbi:MAG: flavin reductase [Eggerthellaceae bacterium]|nr:flavin reductase [Eggerthellaceae bacterium]
MIDRSAFRAVSYGLYIVTARDAEQKYGCVINTFQQVTSAPARVSIALNKENATTQAILDTGRYAVTVLGEQATMDLIGVFGFRSSLEVDKFADVAWEEDPFGVPRVTEGAVAQFSLRVVETLDVGTHIMFIGEVEEAYPVEGDVPMTYAYYHEVKRGKTPAKASSYVPKEEAALAPAEAAADVSADVQPAETAPKKYAWQCSICGHIEYVDELPEDYECPLCGMGVDMFERIEV